MNYFECHDCNIHTNNMNETTEEECNKLGHLCFFKIKRCEGADCDYFERKRGVKLSFCHEEFKHTWEEDGVDLQRVDNQNFLYNLFIKEGKQFCPECLLIPEDIDPTTFKFKY